MRYISVSRENLSVRITGRKPPGEEIAVPVKGKGLKRLFDQKNSPPWAGFYDVIYPDRYRQDRRRSGPKRGQVVCYLLGWPDAWFAAITYIMWEGLVQGLTWDVIKSAVGGALSRMAGSGLAPVQKTRTREAATEVGFSYTKYATNGKKQCELFVGLRRFAKSQMMLGSSPPKPKAAKHRMPKRKAARPTSSAGGVTRRTSLKRRP